MKSKEKAFDLLQKFSKKEKALSFALDESQKLEKKEGYHRESTWKWKERVIDLQEKKGNWKEALCLAQDYYFTMENIKGYSYFTLIAAQK